MEQTIKLPVFEKLQGFDWTKYQLSTTLLVLILDEITKTFYGMFRIPIQ